MMIEPEKTDPQVTLSASPLTTGPAARLIGVGEGTIRLWAKIGRLQFTETSSGVRLFARDDVLRAREHQIEQRSAR
jgi:excisionase family DNA binding protein